MSYKCSECGWSDKPSHKRYYDKNGISRPICSSCNPSLSQKIRVSFHRIIYVLFNGRGIYPPVATIPYIVLLFLWLMYLIPNEVVQVTGEGIALSVSWVTSFFILSLMSQRFAKLLKRKLDNREPVSWFITLFYLPLLIIIVTWFYLLTYSN